METIRFENVSRMKRIGKYAFRHCKLSSIRIPGSVKEMDGSAFVGCPLEMIAVAAGSRNFTIWRCLLTLRDGTMIVRYFGRDREVIVRKTVEILGPLCFESINSIVRVVFENGSKLRQIGSSAFSGCELLASIAIPPSVELIGEFAFEMCDGLKECLIDEDGLHVKLGREAFADCCSLRSFDFPKNVVERLARAVSSDVRLCTCSSSSVICH
jgi:hypothetical protein